MPKTTLTPNALAEKLAGASNRTLVGKTFVRPLLREFFPRDAKAKNTSWFLTDTQIRCVTAAWKAKQRGESPRVAMRDAMKRKPRKAPATSPDAS